MKKMMMIATLCVATIGLAVAAVWSHYDDERPITKSELPAKAQEFLSAYYATSDIKYAAMDVDITSTEYEVVLENGTKIEFNEGGEWRSVDCPGGAVPAAIVPSEICDYVEANYPSCAIDELKRERRGWEVGLNNGLDLEFDATFRLMEIDD